MIKFLVVKEKFLNKFQTNFCIKNLKFCIMHLKTNSLRSQRIFHENMGKMNFTNNVNPFFLFCDVFASKFKGRLRAGIEPRCFS